MLLTKSQIKYYKSDIDRLIGLGDDQSFRVLPQHKVFALIVKDKVVAFGVLGRPRGYWFFRNCVIDREHRGKGYQRQLIRERLNHVRNNGGGRVSVCIDPKNTKSLNNMLGFGFKFKKGGHKHNEHWYQKLYTEI